MVTEMSFGAHISSEFEDWQNKDAIPVGTLLTVNGSFTYSILAGKTGQQQRQFTIKHGYDNLYKTN